MSVAVNVEAQPNERTTNRFQFHKYKWQTLHTDAFHIYFPRGYDSLCAFAARELPGALELTRRRMLSTLRGEPNLIIYPSVDQLYESNVGGFEPTTYTLPTVVLKGNRLLVGFTGSYARFRDDIREAVVRAVWQEQLKPDLLSQAKGSVKAKEIPVWFIEGAIDYFATGWMVKDEDALKEAFRFRDFST